MGLSIFKKHKKEWFLNRVSEVVNREFSILTPAKEKESELSNSVVICSEKHAIALFNYHIDKKINFVESQIKTK